MWPFKKKEISVSFAEYTALANRNLKLVEEKSKEAVSAGLEIGRLRKELVRMNEVVEKSEDEVQKLRDQKELPKYQFGPVAPYGGYNPLRKRNRLPNIEPVVKVLIKDNAWLARAFGPYHMEMRSGIRYETAAQACKSWMKFASSYSIPYVLLGSDEHEYLDLFFRVEPTEVIFPSNYSDKGKTEVVVTTNNRIAQLASQQVAKGRWPGKAKADKLAVVGTHTPQARYTVK